MQKQVRKVSLVGFVPLTIIECSSAHNGVRKRTGAGCATKRVVAVELQNQMKLQWRVPLAMRMLIPQAWNRVPSPIN